ncbi:uncharacterized protein Dana_GF23458, isoform C [Drosophila ananassae]|uniref:Uncharacterized protein, isoform C n=1 Tax=Drosophila ananassae TaxID=7217 RepID=A0A0P8YJC2_DROAN|nr:uncharacterized protein Dana_GF23458, isoform C [Drosophila ananassae]
MMSYQKAKSRHFTVNGLSANNTLQQQQYNLPPSNDTRNIYNNPYIPPQQQQQQQTQQTQQQRTAHLFKALAASATGSNSLTHPYDFSNSSSSSNANNELQGSSSSEADNAFLTHNNGKTNDQTHRNLHDYATSRVCAPAIDTLIRVDSQLRRSLWHWENVSN